ncbi:hypothetical protein [Komagataeibacter rhaeticus]
MPGHDPGASLADARAERGEARRILREGHASCRLPD